MGDQKRSALISFEGIEKVGKTTQILRLAAWLRTIGYPVTVLREPGGTMLGESLRSLLLHTVQIHSAEAELLLFAAARAELVKTVIRPLLAQGHIVIMDRFSDSSVAYQGYGRGIDVQWVETVNQHVTEGLKPDLTFWLKGPSFFEGEDHIEKSGREFFQRVESGYNKLVEQDPARWHIVASMRPVEDVAKDIQHVVKSYLNIE
ncbi:dTMP kinase [Sulfobacillus thermosulfidooxidans]|uniref:dTMP kinase n=1 Tax=Sulfobacillus thermosulfidooxidans TaxID=28034 RepID=UPI0006B59FE6|nr:dTMP kinase [Sulfobacillus thermosulfidooxidans]